MKASLIPMLPRRLTALYKFKDVVIAWQCDHCAKMFFVRVEEAILVEVPRAIRLEFESHSCVYHRVEPVVNSDEFTDGPVQFWRRDTDTKDGRE
jgi:hypothetical protein